LRNAHKLNEGEYLSSGIRGVRNSSWLGLPVALAVAGGILFSVPGAGAVAPSPPIVGYSTYLGGGGTDIGSAIAVDAAGNVSVAGYTDSPDFPGAGGTPGNTPAGFDVFVSRFDFAGRFLWSVRLGGSADDFPVGIALDAAGNLYVAGTTRSLDFPIRGEAFQKRPGGAVDTFLAKLSPDGKLLVSTYLGGSADDYPIGIAVDRLGRFYVSGTTRSANFPVRAALQRRFGGSVDAFVTRLGPTGRLLFSTYVGGSDRETSVGVAVDGKGYPYIAGTTYSENFPLPSSLSTPVPSNRASRPDTFVLKLDHSGARKYSILLEGENTDEAHAIAVDAAGHAHVAGFTDSGDFPLLNDTHTPTTPGENGFLTRIAADGRSLVYSTFLAGNSHDDVQALALDPAGNAYVTGFTDSKDFPASGSLAGDDESGDLFLTKVGPNGVFRFSTYFGGFLDDRSLDIKVDREGRAAVTGFTRSGDYPLKDAIWGCGGCSTPQKFLTIFDTVRQGVPISTFLDEVGEVAVSGTDFYVTGTTSASGSGDFPTVGAFQSQPSGGYDVFVLKLDFNSRAAALSPAPATITGRAAETLSAGLAGLDRPARARRAPGGTAPVP
jgi:hypothetical protein